MQALPIFGGVEFLMMFLLAGGGVPLGVPPQPEDALLAKIAPEECLVYVSSAGMRAAEAGSENETERLLAEPEVQAFAAEFERRATAALRSTRALPCRGCDRPQTSSRATC